MKASERIFSILCDEQWHSEPELQDAIGSCVTGEGIPLRNDPSEGFRALQVALRSISEAFSLRSSYRNGKVSWRIFP